MAFIRSLAVLLALVSVNIFAAIAPQGYGSSGTGMSFNPSWTPLQFCQSHYPTTSYVVEQATSSYSNWTEDVGGTLYYLKANATVLYWCKTSAGANAGSYYPVRVSFCTSGIPAGTAPNHTCATCPPGYTDQGGTCVLPPANPCAGLSGTVQGCIPNTTFMALTGSVKASYNGCVVKSTSGNNQNMVGTVQSYCGEWTYNGAQATTEPVLSTATPTSYSCASGFCLGQFNGMNTCLPCTQDTTNATLTSSTDGSGNTTQTVSRNSGDSTTTDTTTTNSAGQQTASASDLDYNKSTLGASSASCDSVPVCSGDPIQCATLRQNWETMCAVKDLEASQTEDKLTSSDPLVTAGTAALGASMSGVSTDTYNLGNSLDQSGFLTGACLPDKALNLGDMGTVTIPYSEMCWFFEALGALMIAIAAISSAKIVGVF